MKSGLEQQEYWKEETAEQKKKYESLIEKIKKPARYNIYTNFFKI